MQKNWMATTDNAKKTVQTNRVSVWWVFCMFIYFSVVAEKQRTIYNTFGGKMFSTCVFCLFGFLLSFRKQKCSFFGYYNFQCDRSPLFSAFSICFFHCFLIFFPCWMSKQKRLPQTRMIFFLSYRLCFYTVKCKLFL